MILQDFTVRRGSRLRNQCSNALGVARQGAFTGHPGGRAAILRDPFWALDGVLAWFRRRCWRSQDVFLAEATSPWARTSDPFPAAASTLRQTVAVSVQIPALILAYVARIRAFQTSSRSITCPFFEHLSAVLVVLVLARITNATSHRALSRHSLLVRLTLTKRRASDTVRTAIEATGSGYPKSNHQKQNGGHKPRHLAQEISC